MKLKDKTAIITGAASGIGRAIALRFADEGARIVAADFNEERNEETIRELHARGAEAIAVTTDVSNSDSVNNLFAEVDQRGWSVDILVNNAGQGGSLTPIHAVTDADWQAMIATHLNGTFFGTRAAIQRMLRQQTGGAIVNIASVAALRGLPYGASYSAAKGAIISFTKAVSQEVAKDGIRVNAIAPGWVETPILDHLPDNLRAMMIPGTPLGRIGQPEEIAAVALFLASAESSYVIGQTISPNGGLHT